MCAGVRSAEGPLPGGSGGAFTGEKRQYPNREWIKRVLPIGGTPVTPAGKGLLIDPRWGPRQSVAQRSSAHRIAAPAG
jgi:hypothetical protein